MSVSSLPHLRANILEIDVEFERNRQNGGGDWNPKRSCCCRCRVNEEDGVPRDEDGGWGGGEHRVGPEGTRPRRPKARQPRHQAWRRRRPRIRHHLPQVPRLHRCHVSPCTCHLRPSKYKSFISFPLIINLFNFCSPISSLCSEFLLTCSQSLIRSISMGINFSFVLFANRAVEKAS